MDQEIVNWSTFATLATLAATIHWAVARAQIMRWFWDAAWLPELLCNLLACAACSGFWLGLGLGLLGIRPLATGHAWLDVAAAGACGIVGTPLVEGILLWGLERSRI